MYADFICSLVDVKKDSLTKKWSKDLQNIQLKVETVLTRLLGLVPSASIARTVATKVPGGDSSGMVMGGIGTVNTGGLSLVSSTVTNTEQVDWKC